MLGDRDICGMEGVRFYAKLKIVTARSSTGIGVGAKCAFNVQS
jgi:hypothetical protein